MTLVAHRLGEEGYVTFAKALHRLGVVDGAELLTLLAFHGTVLCSTEPPFDHGRRLDKKALEELADELGGHVE